MQPMYGYRNGSIEQYTGRQMVQPNNMQFKIFVQSTGLDKNFPHE